MLIEGLITAALAWGAAPCGMPGVQVIDSYPVPNVAVGGFVVPEPVEGFVPCTIYLVVRPGETFGTFPWDRERTCTIIVHEWGHLMGLGHSNDPLNVMYPAPTRNYWRCKHKWLNRLNLSRRLP